MCLEEPIRDILVNYTPAGKIIDLNFEEMNGIKLEYLGIHSEKVQTKRYDGDQFLNNRCRYMIGSKKCIFITTFTIIFSYLFL